MTQRQSGSRGFDRGGGRRSIFRSRYAKMVYVVESGTAQIRQVRLGAAVGGRFEVEDGLEPGEVVVIRGNERLRTGQKVVVEKPAARRAGPPPFDRG